MTAPQTFESAYKRLEEILELMNSGKLSLEDSLSLYEEADRLIAACNTRLTEAETRIEVLIKNRNGELTVNDQQKPMVQEFLPGKACSKS